MPQDLNLKLSDRISSGLVGLFVLFLPFAFFSVPARWLLLLLVAGIIVANYDLYRFFLKHRGPFFLLRAIPLHALYFLYSAVTFVLCWMRNKVAPARRVEPS
jgi:hypothetical protein